MSIFGHLDENILVEYWEWEVSYGEYGETRSEGLIVTCCTVMLCLVRVIANNNTLKMFHCLVLYFSVLRGIQIHRYAPTML